MGGVHPVVAPAVTPETHVMLFAIDVDCFISLRDAVRFLLFLYNFGDAPPLVLNFPLEFVSAGSSWRIHLSEITRDRLVKAGGYLLEPRGPVEIKGKGLMNTYWLLGKKGFDKVLPNPPPIG